MKRLIPIIGQIFNKKIMKKEVKVMLQFSIGIIVLLCLYFFINKKSTQEGIEFPKIETYLDKEVRGVVTKYSINWNTRGSMLVTLSSNTKLSIYGSTYNFQYREPNLMALITVGDSIFKPANSDSIYLYKNGVKLYFIWNKQIR